MSCVPVVFGQPNKFLDFGQSSASFQAAAAAQQECQSKQAMKRKGEDEAESGSTCAIFIFP